jgi:hypothetical protein
VSNPLSIVIVLVTTASLVGCQAAEPSVPWHAAITRVVTTQPVNLDPDAPEIPRDYAEQEFARPLSREQAFRILLSTDTFAHASVGYAGSKSIQVDSFQILLAQPSALTIFTDLYRRAGAVGRLYALCGLRLLSPTEYAQAAASFPMGDDVIVSEQDGCMTLPRPAHEIVHCSEANVVRLRPGETLKQWVARTNPPKDAGLYFDIEGGAIPQTFRQER